MELGVACGRADMLAPSPEKETLQTACNAIIVVGETGDIASIAAAISEARKLVEPLR